MSKIVLAAVIAAVFIAACGYPSVCACPQHASPPYDATVTNSDHAVTMHVGQKLEVVLRAAQGMNNWSHPTSNDASILEPIVDPAATAAIGITLAAFQAVKPGQVDVTSNASPKCAPNQACPMYLAVYTLKVTVT